MQNLIAKPSTELKKTEIPKKTVSVINVQRSFQWQFQNFREKFSVVDQSGLFVKLKL